MLAAIRPDSYNVPLYLHVGGALALIGTLVVAVFATHFAVRRGDRPAVVFAARTLLLGVLPAFLAMRIGAQLILSEEHLEDADLSWIGIGFATADGAGLLLIVSLILTGLATRRARTAPIAGSGLLRAAGILTSLMILASIVALFAMTTKPT